MMQHCPGCGSQLPDKASFCAHCGYALDATNDQESQTLDKPESASALEKSEKQQDSQDVSALPSIPPLDEDEDAERPMAPILPISQDTLSPVETHGIHEEAQPLPPTSSNMPLSTPISESDASMTLAFPAFEETPLPTEAASIEQRETSVPQEQLETEAPLPIEAASIEQMETPVPQERPETETPLPIEAASVEQMETPVPQEFTQAPLLAERTSLEDIDVPESQASSQTSLALEPAPGEPIETLESQMQSQTLPPTEASTPGELIETLESQEQPEEFLPAEAVTTEETDLSEHQEQPQTLPPTTESTPDEQIAPEVHEVLQTPLPVAEPAPDEQIETPEPQEHPQTLSVAEEPQHISKTPPAAEAAPIEQGETLALQEPSSAVPATSEKIETSKPQELSKTTASTEAANIEEEKIRALPPSPSKPAISNATEVVEPQKRALPPSSSKPAASNRAEIAEQETIIVPAIPKTSLSKPGGNEVKNRPGEVRSGPGSQPRAEFYADSNTMNYQGNQQYGNTLTRPRTIPSAPLPKPAPKPVRTIGGLIWSLISPIFKRARDPEPERPKEARSPSSLLGWLPAFALSSALGLFTTTTAFNAARASTPGSELYYWLGIGLIYLPIVVRLIMPYASRPERVGLLCLATLCLFLTKVSLSPLYYSGYDEFLHWRTINDILSTGHLLTKNPLLPVSPFYPGLEIVASALSNISGMSSIQAGFTAVGVACLLMVLSFFLLTELLSGSARLASIAAVIYMANPHFLFFDTQFAYESLALPLATFVLFAMTRYEALNQHRRWVMLAAWTVLLAMDLTHHATNFVFEGLFLLWAIVYLFLRPLPLRKTIVLPTVLIGIALTVTTVLVIGTTVISYFSSFFADISKEVAQDLGSGGSSSRQLFGGAGTVIQTPLWERLISLGSVGLITLAIPFLLLCFWRRYRRNSLVWVFAIIATFYPVLQVLRLTTSGAEISDRASAFIFIAISFLGAVAIVQFWPVRLLNWKHSAVISTAILVLFMGGIILGEGIPPTFMPGPYEASADSRSIDLEGIQAALWTRIYLGPNQRMYTDRVNQLLMSVYGDQYLVTKIGDNIDVTDVIFDPTVSAYEISRLQKGQVHYLAIDLRLSTQLPQDGFYYEQGESTTGPNGDTTAIDRERLTKFDTVPQINRLFDSGDMAIYDTGGLINAPPIP